MTRLFRCAPLALASLLACGGAATTAKTASSPVQVAAPAEPANTPPAAPTDHSLRRSAVLTVVKGGLGLFLQSVVLDDQPVMKGGHFHGFRIASLDPAVWSGVNLRAGDVVVRVNGMPIEHPEEALEAFRALE